MMNERTARIVTGAAAVLWLVSWFLPVLDDLRGWQAFRYSVSAIWPYRGHSMAGEEAVPSLLSAATNVVFIILVAHVALQRVTRPGFFIRVAIACFILDLYWLAQLVRSGEAGDLRVGYYAWIAAYALLIVSGLSIHRTSKIPTAGTPA
jgi:hypothetical protein